jgi:rhamnosyltransferase subunit B
VSRILLNTWGSLGDLYPYLQIARRLRAIGHTPLLATCGIYREMVEAHGIEFLAVRPDVDPDDSAMLARVMNPRRGAQVIVEEMVAPAVRAAYDDLLPAAEHADCIVSHPVTFAAPLVAGVLRKPWISTVLAPASFFSIYDFPVPAPAPMLAHLLRLGPITGWAVKKLVRAATFTWLGPVRAFRADLGLPDPGDPLFEGQFSPHLTLALYSRVLGDPQPDWPPHAHITGFPFGPPGDALPAEIAAFLDQGDPPIVFTLGSSAVGAAGLFYDDAVGAAEILGRRAILLTGLRGRNRLAAPLPPGILAVDYVAHASVFPHAAAIVHHGGVGTMGEALRAGRPMLVLPFAHDQPDNAVRAARLGVARIARQSRRSADDLASHLHALLTNPSYASRASDVGHIVGGEDGVGRATALIEDLLNAQPDRQATPIVGK